MAFHLPFLRNKKPLIRLCFISVKYVYYISGFRLQDRYLYRRYRLSPANIHNLIDTHIIRTIRDVSDKFIKYFKSIFGIYCFPFGATSPTKYCVDVRKYVNDFRKVCVLQQLFDCDIFQKAKRQVQLLVQLSTSDFSDVSESLRHKIVSIVTVVILYWSIGHLRLSHSS